jgi:hypothetical protein
MKGDIRWVVDSNGISYLKAALKSARADMLLFDIAIPCAKLGTTMRNHRNVLKGSGKDDMRRRERRWQDEV